VQLSYPQTINELSYWACFQVVSKLTWQPVGAIPEFTRQTVWLFVMNFKDASRE